MKITEELGNIHRGGFGIIDKVKCKDGNIYARKTFDPLHKSRYEKSTIDGLRKRFIREVSVQKELPEDLFIPIVYADLTSNNPWFLMPVASDVFTKEIVKCKNEGRNPDGLADILNALEHLHELGYVHRDLKPANILYHGDRWKLADLGLITPKEDLTSTLTNTDDWAGTALYCAPEQLKNFKFVTKHADIYSFGAILHDIYNGSGRVPYTKLTSSGNVGFIIEKCTEPEVRKRFDSVKSLRSSLLSVLTKETIQKSTAVATDEWLDKFSQDIKWDEEELERLYFYLKKNPEERPVIFWEFTQEKIELFHEGNFEFWKNICLLYCDWIDDKNSFDFNYCDVLIDRLWFIYNLSDDLELKCDIVLKSSRLGASHNRWYVMEHVVKMCNHSITDNLATRISIEIRVGGYKVREYFITCVERISRSINSYHEIIGNVLR